MPYFACVSENDQGPNLKGGLAYHQSLGSGWTPRYIDINRYNPVTSSRHTVAVVIIASSICTTTHRNNPSRIRHLVIHLSQSRRHLVCQSTCNNHDIRLTRRGTKDYTKTILIVSWGGKVHHFDSAAGESKGHRPEGALTGPISDLIEGRSMSR
jgi:hypothetical protein